MVVVNAGGIRDLRIGNEFLPRDSIGEISVEACRGRNRIVLTPTPALQRQLRTNSVRHTQNDRVVIRSEGRAADFETVLRARLAPHCSEDEHGAQGFAVQAS